MLGTDVADGLAEEILNALCMIPNLRVASRTSSFRYRGLAASADTIGRELNVATVLEAEGVLVDAIGAIVAVVALEVALSPSGESLAMGGLHLLSRLGLGALLGTVTGLAVAALLRSEHWVPEGLGNVFTLILIAFIGVTFMLLESSRFPAKFTAAMGSDHPAVKHLKEILDDVRRYMVIKTVTSLVTGLMVAGFTYVMGIPYPLLWGVLAFLLNYIPFIGSTLAGIPAVRKLGPGWVGRPLLDVELCVRG